MSHDLNFRHNMHQYLLHSHKQNRLDPTQKCEKNMCLFRVLECPDHFWFCVPPPKKLVGALLVPF